MFAYWSNLKPPVSWRVSGLEALARSDSDSESLPHGFQDTVARNPCGNDSEFVLKRGSPVTPGDSEGLWSGLRPGGPVAAGGADPESESSRPAGPKGCAAAASGATRRKIPACAYDGGLSESALRGDTWLLRPPRGATRRGERGEAARGGGGGTTLRKRRGGSVHVGPLAGVGRPPPASVLRRDDAQLFG